MRDQSAQTMGLSAADGQPARLMAMVCHGDAQAELPMMWLLCDAMTKLNHNVTVLDGTKLEDEFNPGLAQVLEHYAWPLRHSLESQRWRVLPAQSGLQQLVDHDLVDFANDLYWGQLVGPDAVVLIYATADILASIAKQTGVRPLLALSSAKTSLMTSYLALKRLWIHGGIQPTVVQKLDFSAATHNDARAETIAQSLEGCARHFLQMDIEVTQLDDSLESNRLVSGLAQTLLEESVTLEPTWSPTWAKTGRETQAFATRMN